MNGQTHPCSGRRDTRRMARGARHERPSGNHAPMTWPMFAQSEEARRLTPLDADVVPEASMRRRRCVGRMGAITAANDGWRASVGDRSPRLPRGPSPRCSSLFGPREARRPSGEGLLAVWRGQSMKVSVQSSGRRTISWSGSPATFASNHGGGRSTSRPAAPDALDMFAATSPFGAALVEGADPFHATIVETNAALASIAGPAVPTPALALRDLLTPGGRPTRRFALAGPLATQDPMRSRSPPTNERVAHLYLAGARPAMGGLSAGRDRAEEDPAPARAEKQDGGDRPPRWRRRPRLQQSPDGDKPARR